MSHEPLGRIPKNRKKKDTITISVEEYNDLCNMRDYIYDNNLVLTFELYLDVRNHMEEVEKLSREE